MTSSIKQLDFIGLLTDVGENVPIRIFWKDREGRYLGCNTLFARDAGLSSPDELIGKTDYDFAWRDQAELYRADDIRVMDSGLPKPGYEEPQTSPDGKNIWLHTSKVPLHNAQNEVVGILGVYDDITERKCIENERLILESRLRILIEQSPLAMQIVTPDGTTTEVNQAWEKLWGVPHAALANYNLFEDKQLAAAGVMSLFEKVLAGETVTVPDMEYDRNATPEVEGVDGKLWVRTSIYPVKDQRGKVCEIVLLQEDTTFGNTSAQRARLYQEIFALSNDAIAIINTDGSYIEQNAAHRRLIGYSDEELQGETPAIHFGNDVFNAIARKLAGSDVYFGEAKAFAKSGREMTIELSAFPIKNSDGSVHCYAGIKRDITERKQTEERLRASEQRFRDLFESSPDPCWIINEHNLFILCNQVAADILGYASIEELVATHPSKLSPEFQPDGRESLEKADAMMAAAHEKGVHRFEWEHQRKFGECFPVEVTLARIDFEGKQQLYCIWRDISERKKMDEQLRQSQKMEAIGTLVGGIAHDFNNMLAAIQGNVYLAKNKMQNHAALDEKLSNIEELGKHAADMVKQLLAFARQDALSMQVFSLNAFMNEGYKLTRTLVPENINHRNDICSEELRIRGDATQLQQALLNLLNNAIDAVAGVADPKIRCSLKAYTASAGFRRRHPEISANRLACLSVEDNGHGIAQERLDKIFEPFFTTKEVGSGTGLGLAMLYGAVQTHGGVVEVDSKLGRGSTFRVYLPLCEGDKSPSLEPAFEGAPGQDETILLVDDQDEVRASSAEAFGILGYRVLQARTGREALDIFHAQHGRIDLILSDVVMPEMGGQELMQAVRLVDAHLPIILATGYDRQHVLDQGICNDGCHIISKPFDFDALSRTIQELIHSA